jgi:hypothetical protein
MTRKKMNVILSILVDERTFFKPSKVKFEVARFFKGFYSLEKWDKTSYSKLNFQKLLSSSIFVLMVLASFSLKKHGI